MKADALRIVGRAETHPALTPCQQEREEALPDVLELLGAAVPAAQTVLALANAKVTESRV